MSLVAICTVSRSPRPGRLHPLPLGDRAEEIAAEADEGLHLARDDLLADLDGGQPLVARRLEAELLGELVERDELGLLGDADGPLPLDVGMAAHGRHAGAVAADIALQQPQIDELLDVVAAVDVLGQAHAVHRDRALGVDVDVGRRLDVGAGEAAFVLDRRPVGRVDMRP